MGRTRGTSCSSVVEVVVKKSTEGRIMVQLLDEWEKLLVRGQRKFGSWRPSLPGRVETE